MLEVLSRRIRSGYLEELPYVDGLTLASETLKVLKGRLEAWKGALEAKVKKTKMMITSESWKSDIGQVS